ncbi:acyltransferase family protein [Candidatus Omnitrophota bacterium]
MKPQRLYNLDWLRVLVIINMIPFHTAWIMTFVEGFFKVPQDGFIAQTMRLYVAFFTCWHMPLLFFISGVGTGLALNFRSTGEYVRERIKRLLVPLLFFMVFCFPVLAYYWPAIVLEKSITHFFFYFWPEIIKSIHYSDVTGGPGWAHLWFVAYLCIFSFIMLPIFLYLRKKRSRDIIAHFAVFFSRKGMIYLPGFLFVAIHALLSVKFPLCQNNLYTDWAYFSYNLTAFLLGYILCLDLQFWKIIDERFRTALMIGVVTASLVIVMWTIIPAFSTPGYTLGYVVFSALFGFNTWIWMIALLGLSRKYLNFTNGFLRYFNRASYPIYIIHLVIITVIGYYVVEWRTGFVLEFILLTVFSFAAIIVCYELIKRTKITRFLFGMKGENT